MSDALPVDPAIPIDRDRFDARRGLSRRDVRLGRVTPKTIENGVVVPPGLQINRETLAEHQARLQRENLRPFTREEAAATYEAREVRAFFGAAAPRSRKAAPA